MDLKNFSIQTEVIRSIPVDNLLRHNFLPLERQKGSLVIAVADPSRLMMFDEIGGLLSQPIILRVAPLSPITDLLKKPSSHDARVDAAPKASTSTPAHLTNIPTRTFLSRN
jgi:type IV pilus assembly protein PilB